MIYVDYARRKMHNVVKLGTAEGYPLVINNAKSLPIKDYTIYGNTGNVGDMTENLFNYTEPLTNSIKADADGWFDVTIDNTSGTSPLYRNCYTIKNDNLKPNTTYRILVEVSERTGKINFNASSVSDFMPGQFANTTLVTSNSVSTVIKTINNFDNCNNMLRTFCWCDGGKSGHIKFRIAIYETEKGYFEPYNKYKIPIVVSGENNTTIYLNAPLADGESINYKADNLPDIVLNKGSNTITTDTAVKPKKISAKYYKK